MKRITRILQPAQRQLGAANGEAFAPSCVGGALRSLHDEYSSFWRRRANRLRRKDSISIISHMYRCINNMINTYGVAQLRARQDTSNQTRKPRSWGVSYVRARVLQQAGARASIFLATITMLSLASLPCTPGFSTPFAAPAISLSSLSLSFGYTAVGTTSRADSVRLMDTGNAALSIKSITITGADAGDFAQSNNCGNSVAPRANCTISVTFTPSASGIRTGTLTITDNAAGGSQALSLTGIGTAPLINLSPSALSFAARSVGTTSAAQIVNVRNVGQVVLNITALGITGADAGDFALTGSCGGSIAPEGGCTIGITFTPMASGSRTASVSITDNAGGSPQTVRLLGTGLGSAPGTSGTGTSGTGTSPTGISLAPSSVSFGSQPVATTSAAETITLSNGGNIALSISGLAIGGTNSGDFAEIANTCGGSLAAGSTCMIGVTFTPLSAGQRTATLSVTDNASSSPQAASFTGTGMVDVILSWGVSPTTGVVGYNIYRGTSSGGEGSTTLNSTPISSTSYVDVNVTAGTTYYYVLTSVGMNGVQSAPSNETEAQVPTS